MAECKEPDFVGMLFKDMRCYCREPVAIACVVNIQRRSAVQGVVIETVVDLICLRLFE
jgi:hypothetical protein